jgi:hypothetical protein
MRAISFVVNVYRRRKTRPGESATFVLENRRGAGSIATVASRLPPFCVAVARNIRDQISVHSQRASASLHLIAR